MLKINIQLFGGRGAGGGGRYGGGGNVNIVNAEVFGESEQYKGTQHEAVELGLRVMDDVVSEYGANGGTLSEAQFDNGGVLGCCDRQGNVYIATGMMDIQNSNAAYDNDVKSGFHPSRGGYTALEAVAYHEFGHSLVDQAAIKMGIADSMNLATRIVNEARSELKEKGVVIMARKISIYATKNNHETVAEAFADVKCNGDKASAVSKKVVEVLNRYAKS